MVRHACQQHDGFHRATDRRNHLNLLIDDRLEENLKTYGQYKTQQLRKLNKAGTLQFYLGRTNANIQRLSGDDQHSKENENDSNTPRAVKFEPAYLTGSTIAKETVTKIQKGRTDTGGLCNMVNPALGEKQVPGSTYQGQSITQQADDMIRSGKQLPSNWTVQSNKSAEQSGRSYIQYQKEATDSPQKVGMQRRPWDQPWQTGDRVAGRNQSRMICSKRTPIGAFANLDLAVKR